MIGAIQRSLLVLEQEGADQFFGEPALDLQDFMQLDSSGRGYINILSATRLFNSPKLYSTFLIWMLSRLFETLPEVGDLEKPKFVFFFDEAHLLFMMRASSSWKKLSKSFALSGLKEWGSTLLHRILKISLSLYWPSLGIVSNMLCVPIRQRK